VTYSIQTYDFLRKVRFLTNTPLQTPVVRLAKSTVNPGNVYIVFNRLFLYPEFFYNREILKILVISFRQQQYRFSQIAKFLNPSNT